MDFFFTYKKETTAEIMNRTPQGQYVEEARRLIDSLSQCEADIYFMKPEKKQELQQLKFQLEKYIGKVSHSYSPLATRLPLPTARRPQTLTTPVPTRPPPLPSLDTLDVDAITHRVFQELNDRYQPQLQQVQKGTMTSGEFVDRYVPSVVPPERKDLVGEMKRRMKNVFDNWKNQQLN